MEEIRTCGASGVADFRGGPVAAGQCGKLRRYRAGCGFLLGMLIAVWAEDLGLDSIWLFRWADMPFLVGLVGGALALTRARPVLWAAAGGLYALLLFVSCTPIAAPAVKGLVRSDPPRPAEAVVVLSPPIAEEGRFPRVEGRVTRAYELLRRGTARRLVLTRIPWVSYVAPIRAAMRETRLDSPIDEVGPVRTTRDEALAVARLARERGWAEVILVTDPSHSGRAAACFERAGLRVISVPCAWRKYDPDHLDHPVERRRAFRDWIYETYHAWTSRMRGWL